ncbi:alpha/beta fold hydrolase [Actinomarinicola tropica]|uniref:Alpha/beta fold hydrolase n=1 Tax=Actinomarinicola tropica TaxID=2789776 RepID=A0A5Q2RGP3_9ACTN|nr:alpha/beta hydrolase [Actinomarinicola tropica]QGG93992.1 alpha/beta fold hydrolase [Actinomarinicola tropica]
MAPAISHPALPPPPQVLDLPGQAGTTIRTLDWGGTGPPVVLLHPNGFCGGLYEPIAQLLATVARPIAIDLRGHGGSTAPSQPAAYRFEHLAIDVLEVLDQLDLPEAAVVGGSLGGAVAILVHRLDPRRWTRMLLAEPVAFPAGVFPQHAENPMAAAARRRRPTFASRAEMAASYRTKEPLSQLAPEALDAYIRWGTTVEAGSVHLACRPEIEATILEISASGGGAADAWDHLADLTCPTTIAAGEHTFLPDIFAAQAERAHAELIAVPGGHFVLHEDTRRGATLIARHALP